MAAVVPQWEMENLLQASPMGEVEKTSMEMWRVPSYPDMIRTIHSTGDLLTLHQDCEVPDVLPLATYTPEISEDSQRLTLPELCMAMEAVSEPDSPRYAPSGTISPATSQLFTVPQAAAPSFNREKRFTTTSPISSLNLKLNADNVITTWNAMAGKQHPMGLPASDVRRMAASIPSSAHIASSLAVIIEPEETDDDDAIFNHQHYSAAPTPILTNTNRGIRINNTVSSSQATESDNDNDIGAAHTFEDTSMSSGSFASASLAQVPTFTASARVFPPSRLISANSTNHHLVGCKALGSTIKKVSTSSKSASSKRSRQSSRSSMDKRPRYKGRFVRQEELDMLLALEKVQEEEATTAVVPIVLT